MIATLDDLAVEDLVRILREPKNSLIGQYRKLLAYHEADLQFTDGAIREIARIAHAQGHGGQGVARPGGAGLGGHTLRPGA